VIRLLLAHPDIDVNVRNSGGITPFDWACYGGRTSCVREMLKDSRVKVNEAIKEGYTPLRQAAYYGHLDVIKCWIASGREMDLGKPGDKYADAVGIAKMFGGKPEVATLLERFKSDPIKTRSEVREELGNNGQSLHLCFFPFLFHFISFHDKERGSVSFLRGLRGLFGLEEPGGERKDMNGRRAGGENSGETRKDIAGRSFLQSGPASRISPDHVRRCNTEWNTMY